MGHANPVPVIQPQMNAIALPSTQRTDLPGARLSRNAVIVIAVVMLHVGLIWALQSGLKLRPTELIVPVEVLAQLISVRGTPRYLGSDNGPEFVSRA